MSLLKILPQQQPWHVFVLSTPSTDVPLKPSASLLHGCAVSTRLFCHIYIIYTAKQIWYTASVTVGMIWDLLRNPESTFQANAFTQQKEVSQFERAPEQDWVGDLSAPFNCPVHYSRLGRREGERGKASLSQILTVRGEKKLNNKHTPPYWLS